MPSAPARHLLPARSPRRGGFTFIEVMFAVMILAFGVIMVAIMIPVAIRQTQETRETNAGSAVVETGFHDIETAWAMLPAVRQTSDVTMPGAAMPSTRLNPATSQPLLVVSFPSHAWNHAFATYPTPADLWPNLLHFLTLGNRLSSSDARLAYIPFYARDGSLSPQIAFVGVRARNVQELAVPGAADFTARGAFFGVPDGTPGGDFIISDNAPLLVDVRVTSTPQPSADGTRAEKMEPDIVQVYVPGGIEPAFPLPAGTLPLPPDYEQRIHQALVEGAALVLVNDRAQIRILTLGPANSSDEDGFTWYLAPGGDVHATIVSGSAATDFDDRDPPVYRGYLVGRMLKNPADVWDQNDNPYVGPSQVVQVLEGKLLR